MHMSIVLLLMINYLFKCVFAPLYDLKKKNLTMQAHALLYQLSIVISYYVSSAGAVSPLISSRSVFGY